MSPSTRTGWESKRNSPREPPNPPTDLVRSRCAWCYYVIAP
ncbi:MAG: hypothetical protein RLP02_19780 [Coleofasciculus sp. C2-GNP5-27]